MSRSDLAHHGNLSGQTRHRGFLNYEVNRIGLPSSVASSTIIVEVSIALIIFLAIVYAFRRFIGRCTGIVIVRRRLLEAVMSVGPSAAALKCGRPAEDSLLEDLEAGRLPHMFDTNEQEENDEVDSSPLSRVIESPQIPSRLEPLVNAGNRISSSSWDIETGDFGSPCAGAFRPLWIDEGSILPVLGQITPEHRDIGSIAEDEEDEIDEQESEEEGRDEDDGGEERERREDDCGEEGEVSVSMKDQLLDMFTKIDHEATALLGIRLSVSCSLVRSPDNRDLVWEREVGAGTYGRVSLVHHDQGVFAIKEVTEAAGDDERFAAECEMATIIRLGYHSNLVRVFALDNEIPTMPILMEAAVGDLFTAIDTSRFTFSQEAELLHGAASGLAHVHLCGKVHGDIKPSNILLIPVHDGNSITFTAKIADFGFTVDAGQSICTGTRGYGAPELLWHDQAAQPAMDVFSFGAVMLQTFINPHLAEANMFAHSMLLTDAEKTALQDIHAAYPDDPYATKDFQDEVMYRTIFDGSFQSILPVPDNLREDIPHRKFVCQLLRRCLSPDSASRPSMDQVVRDVSLLCNEPA